MVDGRGVEMMKKKDDLIAEELEKWFLLEILPLLGGVSNEEGTAVSSDSAVEKPSKALRPIRK